MVRNTPVEPIGKTDCWTYLTPGIGNEQVFLPFSLAPVFQGERGKVKSSSACVPEFPSWSLEASERQNPITITRTSTRTIKA